MNRAQQVLYRTKLWPRACRAHGWYRLPEVAREAKRREVTLHVSEGRTDSTAEIDHRDECTALFAFLKLLANPSVKTAMDVVDSAHLKAEGDRKRMTWVIDQIAREAGFAEAYIATIAAWDCREAQVSDWRRLPLEGLRRVMIHLNQRKNDKDPQVRQTGPRPKPKPSDEATEYQMKPRRVYQPKQKPMLVPTDERGEEPF